MIPTYQPTYPRSIHLQQIVQDIAGRVLTDEECKTLTEYDEWIRWVVYGVAYKSASTYFRDNNRYIYEALDRYLKRERLFNRIKAWWRKK